MQHRTAIYTVIAKQLDVDLSMIADSSCFTEDLGADSLDIVELLLAVEDEFGCSFSDDDTDTIKTVGDIASLMRRGLPLLSTA